MNKPITMVCGAIGGIGLWILGACLYHALAYGNFEAGNFHRCRYWSEQDVQTGRMVKRWERRWELTESTERAAGSILYEIEAWFVSLVPLFLGAAIWALEWSARDKREG